MAGTYSVDLTTLMEGGGTVFELSGSPNYRRGGSFNVNDADLFYRGTASSTSLAGRNANDRSSIFHDNGSNITATAGHVISFLSINLLVSSGLGLITDATAGVMCGCG